MFFLGQGIQVPEGSKPSVHMNVDKEGKPYDWDKVLRKIFKVLSSTEKPDDPYLAVKFGNYWYYIENTDIHTRETLTMLSIVFSLKAGGIPALPPVLTLPID